MCRYILTFGLLSLLTFFGLGCDQGALEEPNSPSSASTLHSTLTASCSWTRLPVCKPTISTADMCVITRTRLAGVLSSLIVAGVLLVPTGAYAQFYEAAKTSQPPNKVYVEGFGSGGFYSLNYERTIAGGLTARIGAAFMPRVMSEYTAQVIVPITISYLVGYDGHHLEMGAGVTKQMYGRRRGREVSGPFQDREVAGLEYMPGALVGYRYQAPDGGWMFRATYTPFNMKFEGWVSSAGISVGYAF